MKNKRRKFWSVGVPVRFEFVNVILILVIISLAVNAYIVIKIMGDLPLSAREAMVCRFVQFNFLGIMLILVLALAFVLYSCVGPLSRIGGVLDRVAQGEHSLRVHVRKGDALAGFTEKVNKIIELLDKVKKS